MPEQLRKKNYLRTSDALKVLGSISEPEVAWLKKGYPSYALPHRAALLDGMLKGNSHESLVLAKMIAKGIDPLSISRTAKGGHGKWVEAKIRKTAIRIMYLRKVIAEKKSPNEAKKRVWTDFNFPGVEAESAQSLIRKATHSKTLTKELITSLRIEAHLAAPTNKP